MQKKPSDYYRALYEIASEIDSAAAVEKELAALVKSTAKVVGAKACSILVLTEDNNQLVRMASCGLSDSYVDKGLVELDAVTAEALKGNPIIVKDATTDPGVQYREEAKMEGIVSMLSLPLLIKGKVGGVLRLYADKPTEFSVNDIGFLSGVANVGATAISRDQMYSAMEQHYQNSLRESAQELAKLTEAKNRLIESISVVAHDLKAPLAAIQSYFSVMLGGYAGELNEKQKPMIERSSVRIDGLLNLISDLLDLSRIEMGQISQEMEDVSLADVVEGCLEDTRSQAKERDIIFETDIPQGLPLVHGSSIRLKQVFANLVGNAIKFMPGGGSINVRLSAHAGKIEGRVRDTGIGIPADDIPHVFDDFFRASNVEDVSGTGLGLSIVKRIMEAHGGKVRVESPCAETKAGAEFICTIPAVGVYPEKEMKAPGTTVRR